MGFLLADTQSVHRESLSFIRRNFDAGAAGFSRAAAARHEFEQKRWGRPAIRATRKKDAHAARSHW